MSNLESMRTKNNVILRFSVLLLKLFCFILLELCDWTVVEQWQRKKGEKVQ